MGALRRYYHEQVRHHHRFYIAVVLTIVAVSGLVVPIVADVVDSFAHYNPRYYEPRDPERAEWLMRRGGGDQTTLPLEDLVKILLFVLAGVAWLAVGPRDAGGRRSPRR